MKFSTEIIRWYQSHKRDLPWRKTSDAYSIWLSEIIMQQTRVKQGLKYYERFLDHYPTIELLADTEESEVLKLWQGLGYYSRARNLLKTARHISEKHQGKIPRDYHALIQLPGIGSYTASAILSMAFNQTYPVVDGNVLRLMSRIFGVDLPVDLSAGKKAIESLARKHIDKSQPGDYNQAVMEFGAMYCKPNNPDCLACIFRRKCLAFQQKKVADWPVKSKKIKQKKRYLAYLIFIFEKEKGKFLYLNHRDKNDIWKGLYDFPHISSDKKMPAKELQLLLIKQFRIKKGILQCVEQNVKHMLTHQIIFASFYLLKLETGNKKIHQKLLQSGYEPQALSNVNTFPLSRLIEIFLKKNHKKLE